MKKIIILNLFLFFYIIGFSQNYKTIYNPFIDNFDYVTDQSVELISRTIYLDSLSGNDQSGCGTAASPFQTVKRALQDINPIIAADITIQADSMQYEFNYSEISALTRLLTLTNGASLIFKGLTKDYTTITLTQDGTLSSLYTYTGATLSDNEIRGMFVNKDVSNHFPIAENDDDSLWICDVTSAGSRTIYKNMVTFINSESDQNWLELPIGNICGGSIQFENIIFDDDNRFNFTTGGSKFYFRRCNFDQLFNISLAQNPPTQMSRINFSQCNFDIIELPIEGKIVANDGGQFSIRDCAFNGIGIEINILFHNVINSSLANTILNNCKYRLLGSSVFNQKAITLKDLDDAIVAQTDCDIYGNEVNSELILYNVNNLFSYGNGNQFQSIIRGGYVDLEGSYTNLFAEIPGYQALEDYQIVLPGLWQKNERIITDITNNTSGNIEIGDTLQNKAIYIDYTVTRQDSTEIGTIVVSGRNDTDINDVMDSTFDDAEITFSKNVSGSTIRIGYVLSDATYDAELNMIIRRTYN